MTTGGLAAAAALLQRGFDVRLYERAGHLSEISAGIQLTPDAVKVLVALAAAAGLEAHGSDENLQGFRRAVADGRAFHRRPIDHVGDHAELSEFLTAENLV